MIMKYVAYTGIGVAFSAAELLDEADDTLRAALGGIDAKALGRQLAKLEGRDIDGLMLRKLKHGANGNVWSLARAS